MNDVTIEYVLGDEKFTCTAWFDGKAEPACVVDFSYMGDMENTILDKVSTKFYLDLLQQVRWYKTEGVFMIRVSLQGSVIPYLKSNC